MLFQNLRPTLFGTICFQNLVALWQTTINLGNAVLDYQDLILVTTQNITRSPIPMLKPGNN